MNRVNKAEIEGLERTKDAAVSWLKQWLHSMRDTYYPVGLCIFQLIAREE